MRHATLSFAFAVVLVLPAVSVGASENGPLAVYGDQFQGRATASGVPYDAGKLTAAHASMPFGTMVRVANFDTGRMVDVVINDRKGDDGRIVTLSRAAAEAVQLPVNRTAPGSLLVIQLVSMNSGSDSPRTAGHISAPAPTTPPASGRIPAPAPPASPSQTFLQRGQPLAVGEPAARKFRPFGGIFDKESAPDTQFASTQVKYGIPAAQYDSHFSQTAPVYPANVQYSNQVITRMNAGGPITPVPTASQSVVNRGQVIGMPVTPVASSASPYRVQFGAFRRVVNANELAGMLGGAGVPSEVFASPGTGLNLVVTRGGFATAEDAQRWIDFEGTRRGWKERPVVIR